MPHHSLSLSLSLWCLSILTFPSSFFLMFSSITSSPLCLTLKMSGSWQAFSWNKQENEKGNLTCWALWQFLNETPHEGGFLFLVEAGFMNGAGAALKALHCTSSINNSLLFESLSAPWTLSLLQTDTTCILEHRVTTKYVGAAVKDLQGGRTKWP